MRAKLGQGQQITLICDGTEKNFIIEKVIGDGANCIAYQTMRTDMEGNIEHYRLKECYPFNAKIIRKGTTLEWENDVEKKTAFERLKKTHSIISQLKAEETVGNNITSSILCEGNGTLYSVMDINYATVYSKDKTKDIEKVLEAMLVLTKIVGNIHKQGYLHLDIKPDNFLVNYEPNTNVWLFDVDSLTKIEDIKLGAVYNTPYSQAYAAPEQKMGNIERLCPATDIYAIGAILFERLMGRKPTNNDTGVFAEWEFDDNDMFENISPKAKRQIKDIFRKTLSSSIKRRYQSAEEMVTSLEEVIKSVKDKMYVVSNYPISTIDFIGREKELKAIDIAFENGKKVVFLQGFGGIGKSEIAKKYIQINKSKYDTILFLEYKGDLKNCIEEIKIENFDDSVKHNKSLRRILNKNVLIIVDNYDVAIGEDEYFEELIKFDCNLLITTRTDFSLEYSGEATQIYVPELSYDQLEKMFMNRSNLDVISVKEQEELKSLFELVEYHTYAVELLAKQRVVSDKTIFELVETMKLGLVSFDSYEKIRDKSLKKTIPDFIRAMFRIANLTEKQKKVLIDLYLFDAIEIDISTYRELFKAEVCDIEALNDLLELRWIMKSNKANSKNNYYLHLHTLVKEMITMELKPSISNREETYWNIFLSYRDDIESYRDRILKSAASHTYSKLFVSFINNLDFNNSYNISFISSMTEETDYLNKEDMIVFSDKVLKTIKEYGFEAYETLDICCNMFTYWLKNALPETGKYVEEFFKYIEMHIQRVNPVFSNHYFGKVASSVKSWMYHAESIFYHIDRREKIEKMKANNSNIISEDMYEKYFPNIQYYILPRKIIEWVVEESDTEIDIPYEVKKICGFEISDEEIEAWNEEQKRIDEEAEKWRESFEPSSDDGLSEFYYHWIKPSDLENSILKFKENKELSSDKKIRIISDFFGMLFQILYVSIKNIEIIQEGMKNLQYIKENMAELYDLLQYQEDLLDEIEWDWDDPEDEDNIRIENITYLEWYRGDAYFAILLVIDDDIVLFNKIVEEIIDNELNKKLDRAIGFYDPQQTFYNSSFGYICKALMRLQKCSLVAKYIVSENNIDKKDNFELLEFTKNNFSKIGNIIDILDIVISEKDLSEEDTKYYIELQERCKKAYNQASSKGFIFKKDNSK